MAIVQRDGSSTPEIPHLHRRAGQHFVESACSKVSESSPTDRGQRGHGLFDGSRPQPNLGGFIAPKWHLRSRLRSTSPLMDGACRFTSPRR